MKFEKTMYIDSATIDEVEKYLTEEPSCEEECLSENETISCTATFDNGYQLDVKCCGVQYNEGGNNTAWTEAVLFDENGNELTCSEPMDTFTGEWALEYKGDEYCVNVVKESKKTKVKVYMELESDDPEKLKSILLHHADYIIDFDNNTDILSSVSGVTVCSDDNDISNQIEMISKIISKNKEV